MAGSGLRIAEALAVSIDEFDFVHHVLHVRRQLKKLGTEHAGHCPRTTWSATCRWPARWKTLCWPS
jgi:hypothetical protein